jgi:hypothetical protein
MIRSFITILPEMTTFAMGNRETANVKREMTRDNSA